MYVQTPTHLAAEIVHFHVPGDGMDNVGRFSSRVLISLFLMSLSNLYTWYFYFIFLILDDVHSMRCMSRLPTHTTSCDQKPPRVSSFSIASRRSSTAPLMVESSLVASSANRFPSVCAEQQDTKYRDWGWDMFQAFEKHCRVATGGYSSLASVLTVPAPMR